MSVTVAFAAMSVGRASIATHIQGNVIVLVVMELSYVTCAVSGVLTEIGIIVRYFRLQT